MVAVQDLKTKLIVETLSHYSLLVVLCNEFGMAEIEM